MKLRSISDRDYKEPAIVPLVNIVFLLLIFFMLLGRITAPDAIEVMPPFSTSGGRIENQSDILVLVSADGRLALEDTEIEQDLMLSAVSKLLEEDASARVRIKADSRLDAVSLIKLMELLKETGVKTLLLLIERPQDEW